jgi:sugar fermentation stimulation protein A
MAFIPFPEPRIKATFLGRRKRFLADMRLPDGQEVVAHCANTGSMKGCLHPGRQAILWDADKPGRKLRYSWKAIEAPTAWVGIDTSLPNALAAAAIAAGELPALGPVARLQRERKMGERSRVDLLLTSPDEIRAWVEVKNVTLVQDGVARFPDAVTARGLKHLHELGDRVAEGDRAAMIYVVQRGDGARFEPAADLDPAYAAGLKEAVARGVEVYVLGTEVSPEGVRTTGLLAWKT